MSEAKVEYRSNNSGGRWWLTDEDWYALEEAGWEVEWFKDDRFLGALASSAVRRGLSLREAAAEWEQITGSRATDAGCTCCGPPHAFTEYDEEGKYVASGPHAEYSASW